MSLKRPHKVLIVDDSEDIRILIERCLIQAGVNCVKAKDGAVATTMLKNTDFDLVLTDLAMPKKHGHQLIMELLEKGYSRPIVAMTGVRDPRIVTDLMNRGVADVISKPVDWDLLAAKIVAIIDRHHRTNKSPGRSGNEDVTDQLERVTGSLRKQLADVTKSFETSIEDLELNQKKLETGYVQSVRLLTSLVNQVDKSEETHAGRVEKCVTYICKRLGLKRRALIELQIAALLHEIGQFGMPDRIKSNPPWRLESKDIDIYRKYPLIGATLLSSIEGAEEIVEIVKSHAENYDGTGFPVRLVGDEIPFTARILRIADGYDTYLMFCDEDRTDEDGTIADHLRSNSGKRYDPDLIDLTIQYHETALEHLEDHEIRRIGASELRAGLILAESLYDADGRFLAKSGSQITKSTLPIIRELLSDNEVCVLSETIKKRK